VRRAAILATCLIGAAVVVAAPLADSVTGPTLTLSESSQYEHIVGTTLYYAPTDANNGSFTVAATASAGSGIANVAFPAVFGSDSSVDSTSPYAHTYSWEAGTAVSGAKTVTATDKDTPADVATAAFTLTPDTTAPTGQSIALGGGPGFSALSVPLTPENGIDAGSGVNTSRGTVERASAELAGGACGSFGPYSEVGLTDGADTTVTSGACYRYRYRAADNVGNVSAPSTPTPDAEVDATPSTTPTLLFTGLTNTAASGSVVYYPPAGSGSFAVTVTASDAESGIASYTFPAIPGSAVAGAGPSRVFRLSGEQTSATGPLAVTATNGTGLTSAAASFTLVADAAPPVVAIRCNGRPCVATGYRKPVTVTLPATDAGGSGLHTIRYTVDGGTPDDDTGADYEGPLVVSTLTRLKVRAYDRVGNASAVVGATVRSLADRLVFTAPRRLAAKVGVRFLSARVVSTRRAIVSATMSGPNLGKPQRWRFILDSGLSIVRLRLAARPAARAGYRISWAAQAGSQTAKATTWVAFRRSRAK
jgi:hypothetical protein